ncbi:MAG: amidohydrolase/deacetylase family metallohydrolase [Candidatus Limnocylindrales bacterium]
MSRYDLVIAGGTVIDPASGRNEPLDVGVAGGRIAAIEPHLSGGDTDVVIDASGQYVVPGLVDLHVHVYPGVADLSVEADPTCLGRGVTTAVDAGSVGANTWPGFRRWVIEASRGRILAFLNISLSGQIDPFLGELHDLRFADPERAARVAAANPDAIVGFKVRLSEMLAGPNGLEGLRRAEEAGRATDLPVMAHIGGTPFDIEEALALLRPGDVVTHAYTGWRPGAIVADNGRLVAGAREARERGVRFDVGHGAGSFTWAVAEAALADGFLPDTISSDLHRFNIATPVEDMATTLSKFLLLGLPLEQVIAMATTAPAAALGAAGAGLGRLEVGGEADITVLALHEGRTRLVDSHAIARDAERRLVPTAVVRAGVVVPIEAQVTLPPAGIALG